MVQGNGQVVNTISDINGNFTFSIAQSDSVSIYIPSFNGYTWRSVMSVADVTTADLANPATIYSYTDTSPVAAAVHDFVYSAVSDDGGHWIKVHEKQNRIVTIDAGPFVVNGVYQQYGTGNVRVNIDGQPYNYYQRLTYKSLFDFHSNFAIFWSNKSNVFNTDFKIYSRYSDLVAGSNSWPLCNYTIGYTGKRMKGFPNLLRINL